MVDAVHYGERVWGKWMELGDKLKALRLSQGMTLAALSREAGVSKSMLSRIERNDSAPTTTSLQKIAVALGVDMAALFSGTVANGGGRADWGIHPGAMHPSSVVSGGLPGYPAPPSGNGRDLDVSIVRADQRKTVIMPWGADYEMLCPTMQRRIEFILITYPVDGGSGDLYAHEGEECGFVVKGRFRGVVGEQEIILEPGDSIYYSSSTPHRWENAGDVEAKAVWAVTPPSFLSGILIGKISST